MNKGEKGALIFDEKISFKGEQAKSSESKKKANQKISNNKKISDFFPGKNTESGGVILVKAEIMDEERKDLPKNDRDFTQKKRLRNSTSNLKETLKNPMIVDLEDFPLEHKLIRSDKSNKKVDSDQKAEVRKRKKDNRSSCSICRLGGELLLCDNCPKSFHIDCLKMKNSDVPEAEWYCLDCV
jgi:hypothetical protein